MFSVVTIAIAFVSTPLLLRWLGDERFGAFRALTDWGAYLALFELGLGGALAAAVSRAATQGPERVRETIAAGGAGYRRVALAVAIGATVLMLLAPWLVPVSPELVGELRLAAAIGALGAAGMLVAAGRSTLEALQRGYVVNTALVAQSLVITAASLLLAWSGWGMPGMAAAVVLGAAVYAAMLVRGLWRFDATLPATMFRGNFPAETRSNLRRLGWPMFINRLSGTLALFSDNILVAWALGPAVVVPFFVTQRLAQVATGQLQGLGAASWAGLAEIHHQGDAALFRERVLELTRLVVFGGCVVLGPILLFNDRFVALWVGESRYAGLPVTLLAVVNSGLLAVLSLWGWLFLGAGRPHAIMPVNLTASIVNVVVSVVATLGLGVVGPLMGSFAGLAGVSAWWTPRLMKREFGFRLRDLAASLVQPLLWTSPPLLVALAALAAWPDRPTWPLLLVEMAGLAAVTLAWGWFVTLTTEERTRWRGRFAKLERRV